MPEADIDSEVALNSDCSHAQNQRTQVAQDVNYFFLLDFLASFATNMPGWKELKVARLSPDGPVACVSGGSLRSGQRQEAWAGSLQGCQGTSGPAT